MSQVIHRMKCYTELLVPKFGMIWIFNDKMWMSELNTENQQLLYRKKRR